MNVPRNFTNEVKKTVQTDHIKQIQRLMEEVNKNQVVFNEKKFKPLRNDSLIIVIQVRQFFIQQIFVKYFPS